MAVNNDDLTPWEKLQVLTVYNTLKKVYLPRPNTVDELLLERIANKYVRHRDSTD